MSAAKDAIVDCWFSLGRVGGLVFLLFLSWVCSFSLGVAFALSGFLVSCGKGNEVYGNVVLLPKILKESLTKEGRLLKLGLLLSTCCLFFYISSAYSVHVHVHVQEEKEVCVAR